MLVVQANPPGIVRKVVEKEEVEPDVSAEAAAARGCLRGQRQWKRRGVEGVFSLVGSVEHEGSSCCEIISPPTK